MLIVGNSIVSEDIKTKRFCCNISKCRGLCCVEGDFGAPITTEEEKIIANLLPEILPHLPEKSQQVINSLGFSAKDDEGNLVTQIVDGKECVFAFKSPEGYTYCIFQKFHADGKSDFIKPVSCHLYPIRVSEYDEMSALNFHEWEVCETALQEGKEKNVYVYQNCKQALIRRFGEQWYKELVDSIEKN